MYFLKLNHFSTLLVYFQIVAGVGVYHFAAWDDVKIVYRGHNWKKENIKEQ